MRAPILQFSTRSKTRKYVVSPQFYRPMSITENFSFIQSIKNVYASKGGPVILCAHSTNTQVYSQSIRSAQTMVAPFGDLIFRRRARHGFGPAGPLGNPIVIWETT